MIKSLNSKVLVTGSNGFVGHRLSEMLLENGVDVSGYSRRAYAANYPVFIGADLCDRAGLEPALKDMDVVVHAAARAHVMNDKSCSPIDEYRKVNVEGSIAVAQAALDAGVKRFIYISSIKVNGEFTSDGDTFSNTSNAKPEDEYGISKYEAELALKELAQGSGMEVVIIRPPLVYGKGVKGNFANLLKIVKKGIPLPLGAVHNKRSLVFLENLTDLIINCITNPAAANQTFLVSDGEDLSTTELLTEISVATETKARLVPVPHGLLKFFLRVLGKKGIEQKLLSNLQVDITHTKETLNWKPPYSVSDGLQRCSLNNGCNHD